jgi:hypothetical protein
MADPSLTPVKEYDACDAVRRFEEAESTTREARNAAERDRDYYDGKQWTAEEETAMKRRGQPVVTFNRIQRKINYLKGLEAQTRKDPKAFPRTPGDDGSAQAATDALRYICDDSQWDAIRSEAFEGMLVEGTGAVFVGVREGKQGVDPELVHIPFDRHYADPYSRRIDFSDAAYQGIVTWKELADVERAFPDRKDVIEATWKASQNSQTYDDRPKSGLWADFKRKRVRVCEEYYLEGGQWMCATFTQGGYLKDPEPSPYLDEDGKPECPIKAVSAYVDRDNSRYGEVRAMISPQDEVNKRRSKGLHLINSRQVRVGRAAAIDISTVKRELAKPDGAIIADKDDLEVLQTGDMAAANFQMLQEAKAEIDLLGPNAALAGKNENDASGRAILAQQQGGMVEVALLMDRLRALSLSVYRAIWARIKQYWTDQRWVRVTDDDRNLKFVGLNKPKTMIEVAAERLEGDPEAEMKLAMLARDPMAQQVMEVENEVAEMDIDIIIDEGVDTPMIQAEQFDTLSKLMPSLINLPPAYAKMMVVASGLRDKDKLLEILEEVAAPDPMAAQIQQAQTQMEFQNAQATIEKTQSETARNYADAEAKGMQAGTQLMTAQANALHKSNELQQRSMEAEQGFEQRDRHAVMSAAQKAQQPTA